jgi:hypothetical protein
MALCELRTYTLRVGAMAEAVKLYQGLGFPALQKGGQDNKLVGYFQADTGTINQLVHLWKSTTTPTAVRIGRRSSRTRILSRVSPRSSGRCS